MCNYCKAREAKASNQERLAVLCTLVSAELLEVAASIHGVLAGDAPSVTRLHRPSGAALAAIQIELAGLDGNAALFAEPAETLARIVESLMACEVRPVHVTGESVKLDN